MIDKLFDAMFTGILTQIIIKQMITEDRTGKSKMSGNIRLRIELYAGGYNVGFTFHPDEKLRGGWNDFFKKTLQKMLFTLYHATDDQHLMELSNEL